MPFDAHYKPCDALSALGEGFGQVAAPARFPEAALRFRNQRHARRVGLGSLDEGQWRRAFWELLPLPQSLPAPVAMRYHGHQFHHYNPELGDGRGFVLSQLRDSPQGRLLDLGTKGSGRTPWSRSGDGRLTLQGGVREVLATELLEALGVNTSKSLSLFETGERLQRHDEPSPTRSAILVRLSHSHIRFGTFECHAYERNPRRLVRLVEYCAEHLLPEIADEPDLPMALMRAVVRRTAVLTASWMVAGFVHGVLNTDNMSITAESFDYGPYRFLPRYDEQFVAAYFDHNGLYAYGRQPAAVIWNLARLAEALGHIAPSGALSDTIYGFMPTYLKAYRARFLARLGVLPRGEQADEGLIEAVHAFLSGSAVGYERFFFDWYGGMASARRALDGMASVRYDGAAFGAMRRKLRRYEPAHPGRLRHPYFERREPCTLLIDELRQIWHQIVQDDDWSAFERRIEDIRLMGEALFEPSLHGSVEA